MADEKRYLKELSDRLDDAVKQIESLTEANGYEKLLDELKNIVEQEKDLREKCGIEGRFKVVCMQLQTLLEEFTKEIESAVKAREDSSKPQEILAADEILVYVYLFNAQGVSLKSWQNLLLPRALIEHSVNRPIYSEKDNVETVLRNKINKIQHAYIEIAIKKDDIQKLSPEVVLQDKQGFPLLKIKHGSLKVEKIKNFVHNGKIYSVSKDGTLMIKEKDLVDEI